MANNLVREQHLQALAETSQQYTRNIQSETIDLLTEAFQAASGSTALPVAGASTLGGVKIGAGLSMVGDTLTANSSSSTEIMNKLVTIEDKIDGLGGVGTTKIEPTINFMDTSGNSVVSELAVEALGNITYDIDNAMLYSFYLYYVGDGKICIKDESDTCYVYTMEIELDTPNEKLYEIRFFRAMGDTISQPTNFYISATEGEYYAPKTITATFTPS